MKTILLTLLTMVAFLSAKSQEEYILKGTIQGEVKENLYLKKFTPKGWVDVTNVEVVDGTFEIKGSVPSPELHMLVVGQRKVVSNIFLENSTITITANANNIDANGAMKDVKVEGSNSHDIFTKFFDEAKTIQEKAIRLSKAHSQANTSGNQEQLSKAKADFDASVHNLHVFMTEFAQKHTDSPVSAFVVLVQPEGTIPMETLKVLQKEWEANIPESMYVKILSEKIKAAAPLMIGAIAPDFELNTPKGNPLKLSSLRGQYVLIDFWASWCGPCRRENPNVLRLYNQYKDKGFDVLSVSLDTNKEKWLQAIAKDGLTWNHVSDLKKWDSKAGKLYQVRSIPHTVLLDKEGKIVAKNLRGAALEAKLAELIK